MSCVSGYTLAAEGAPLTVTATPVATGWIAHVDTAAICGQAAWRAGLRVGRGAQIIQLNGRDTGEEMGGLVNLEKMRGKVKLKKGETGYEVKLEKYKQRKTTRKQEGKRGGNRREEKVEKLRCEEGNRERCQEVSSLHTEGKKAK